MAARYSLIRDSFASSEPEPIRREREDPGCRHARTERRGMREVESERERKKPHQKYGRSAV